MYRNSNLMNLEYKKKKASWADIFCKREENRGLVINAIWRTTKLTRNRVPWLVKQLSCLTNTWRDLGTASVRGPSLLRQSVRLVVSVGGYHSLCCCHYSCNIIIIERHYPRKFLFFFCLSLSVVLLFKLTRPFHWSFRYIYSCPCFAPANI